MEQGEHPPERGEMVPNRGGRKALRQLRTDIAEDVLFRKHAKVASAEERSEVLVDQASVVRLV